MTKRKQGKKSKKCFVIAPIGDEGSEDRKWSDEVLELIVKPAAEKHGYEVIRADHIQEPGIITTQVIQLCAEADLVVANLTDQNPNVFYELAIRHAVGKPVIQLIQKGQSIPFDVKSLRTLTFDKNTPSSFLHCKEQMEAFIQQIADGTPEPDNPITIAIGALQLSESEHPLEKAAARTLSLLEGLHSMAKSQRELERQRERAAGQTTLREFNKGLTFDEYLDRRRANQGRMRKASEEMRKYISCSMCGSKEDVRVHTRIGATLGDTDLGFLLCPKCAENKRKAGEIV